MESKKKVIKQKEFVYLIYIFFIFFSSRKFCQAVVQCVLLLQLPIFTMELLLATLAGINPASEGVEEDHKVMGEGYNKNIFLDLDKP